MNESAIREEVQHMFRDLGWNDYHPPDVAFKGAPVGGVSMGRPDIYLLNTSDASIVCEVKTFTQVKTIELYFDPNRISNKQRRWLDWWVYGRTGAGYLAIGTLVRPRRLFLVPWSWYVEQEFFQRNREAMTWELDPSTLDEHIGLPKKMPISLFEMVSWECIWSNGGWTIPSGHGIHNFKTILHKPEQWHTVSLRMEE
jgi:hypothetical protein